MILKSRLVLVVGLASLALVACKRERDSASDPRPPAEAPPPPPAPNLPPPEGEPQEPDAQAEQAPADQAQQGGAPAGGGLSPEARAEAEQLWTTLCITCHGANGEGDGPVAASFPVKPRSFKDREWQKQTSDESIAKVIVEGGASIGKSPLMPANPQLAGKPEVVQALVQKVRSFRQ